MYKITLKNQILEIDDFDFSEIDQGEIQFDYEDTTYCICCPEFDPDDYENYELPRTLPLYDDLTCKFIDNITLDDELYEFLSECIVENLEYDEDWD